MKTRKVFLSLLLLFVATLSVHAYDFEVNGIAYNITSATGHTCSVTVNSYSGTVSIPEKVSYNGTDYKVTGIEDGAFKSNTAITAVSIPGTVGTLPNYTFKGCTSLKTVSIKDASSSLTVGLKIFGSCPLDSVYVGRTIAYSFNVNSGSNELYTPFYGNKTLRAIHLSDNVKSIPKYFLYRCTGLKRIYGMKQVTSIGSNFVYGCSELTSLVFPNTVTEIGGWCNEYCTNLEYIVVGNGVASLKSNNFCLDCSNLKRLYLGNGIQTFTQYSSSTPTLEKVYLFSDKMTEIGTSNLNTNVFYVPNPEIYSTLLSKYNVQPLITFAKNTLPYTGKAPELSFKNNVEGMEATLDTSSLPKEVGTHSTTVHATFKGMDWETSCDVPVTYTITPAPLTIQANNAQRYYGEENPELTCEYIGLKNGETSSVLTTQPTVYTNATSESNAGTYPIYCTGAEAKNYTITMQNGTLTINKVPQTITWEQDFTDVHVGDMIELTATCSSGLAVKYRSSDTSSVLITTKNGKQYAFILKAGYAAITAYQSGDANHEEADEVSLLVSATTTGIDNINANNDPNATYYNMSGQRVKKPASGLVIKRSADGSTKKVVVK